MNCETINRPSEVATDFVIPFQGREVFVAVSPCSWMYAGYGLQIRLSVKANAYNAEAEFVRERSIAAETMSRAELHAAATVLATQWLEMNGPAKLDKAVTDWAVKAAKFDKAIAKEARKEAKARLKRLTKLQEQGFTHVVDAWIHPKSGDDYQTEVCLSAAPDAADISRVLRPSTCKTDYKVSTIADVVAQLTPQPQ